jgi:hypothetical protein
MVDLMCLSQGPEIYVVGFREPFETLVDKHIVNHEICDTVKGYADADEEHKAISGHKTADTEKSYGDAGKHDKEIIVLFEELLRLVVVIFMQFPEQAMHDVFMREPGYTFHEAECD